MFVTTSLKADRELVVLAKKVAAELRLPFVPRRGSLEGIKQEYGSTWAVVVTREQIFVSTPGGAFFFHPGMAKNRIKALKKGNNDQMVEAMALAPGDTVLDCTLGLGADATVASFAVGPEGKVVGLEKVPVVAFIVAKGMQEYDEDDPALIAAMRRVEVINADAGEYLRDLPDRSFDVVYFDPMFRQPVHESAAIKPLRYLAETEPLTPDLVAEALRVARRRVVVKERRNSPEFARLGITRISGGKHSSIAYGILEPEEAEEWRSRVYGRE